MKNILLKIMAITLFTFISLEICSQQELRYYMQSKDGYKSSIAYGSNPEKAHYVQSDDAKIYYEIYGEGKPLVVLHGGIVGSTVEMGQFIDSLSQKYKVIAISTRGHGKSEAGLVAPSYDQKAKDVYNVLQNENIIDPIIILGFSDGAYTGYYFARDYPDRIDRLIAIGAGEWKKGFRNFNATYDSLYSTDSSYWDQQIKLNPQPQYIDQWFSSITKYYNSIEIGPNIFEKVQCPVLIMAGEKDGNAPLKTIISAYQSIPNAQLAIIPNAPHPVFIDNFAAVWSSMIPFLK